MIAAAYYASSWELVVVAALAGAVLAVFLFRPPPTRGA